VHTEIYCCKPAYLNVALTQQHSVLNTHTVRYVKLTETSQFLDTSGKAENSVSAAVRRLQQQQASWNAIHASLGLATPPDSVLPLLRSAGPSDSSMHSRERGAAW